MNKGERRPPKTEMTCPRTFLPKKEKNQKKKKRKESKLENVVVVLKLHLHYFEVNL